MLENIYWKIFHGKIVGLSRVLRSSEQYRLERERERKKREQEARRKDLVTWVPWVSEEEPMEEEDTEQEDLPVAVWGIRKIFAGFGSSFVLCFLLLLAGLACNLFRPDVEKIAAGCELLFAAASAVTALLCVYPVQNNLYRDVNLPYYMTLPFTARQFLMAEYLQLAGMAYRCMEVLTLPTWLGFTIGHGWDGYLAETVFLGLLVLPQAVLLLVFIFVILFHSYVRLVLAKNFRRGLAVPLAVLLSGLLLLTGLGFLTEGKVPVFLGRFLWKWLLLYYPLGQLVLERQIVPFFHILIINVVIWFGFLRGICKWLYRPSVLQRWDLAGDREETGPGLSKVMKKNGMLKALFLREIRTLKGIKAYRIPAWFSSGLLPFCLLLAFACTEYLELRFFHGGKNPADHFWFVLCGYIFPLTVLPAVLNRPAATAFSRDSHFLEILLFMPLDRKLLGCAKVLASLYSCAKGSVPWVLILNSWLLYRERIPVWGFFVNIFLNLFLLGCISFLQTYRDLKRPETDWKTYKELLEISADGTLVLLILISLICFAMIGVLLEMIGLPTAWGLFWLLFFIFTAFSLVVIPCAFRGMEYLESYGK